jgi:arginyl-tRNA synthetase
MFEKELLSLLKKELGEEIPLEAPSVPEFGDFAFPCFILAKKLKKNPVQIAAELAKKLDNKKPEFVIKVEARGPYVNFFIDNAYLGKKVLTEIFSNRANYGAENWGKGKTIVVDYSHPNIGKPFHFGHLRSTVIGQSLCLMHKFFGYRPVRENYLGDWGTQFGALIYAHLNWGDRKKLEIEPIKYLFDLYVRFHKEVEKKPELQEEAKQWFKKLEDGNAEALKLWSKFRQLSLDEFRKIYKIMGVEFDSYSGESFYQNKISKTVELIEKKKLAKIDQGALVVPMPEGMPPCILRKSDEASTYASRDLAAIKYRLETYKPEKILYVVGAEQTLHFQQIFNVAEKMSWNSAKLVHIPFGLYLSSGGQKMATRKGEAIKLDDVLKQTIAKAKKAIEDKNPTLKNKDKVASQVAIGAIIFGDLMNDRIKDVVFDWDKILDFEGDTGPYLQYTCARACSILRKAKEQKLVPNSKVDFSKLTGGAEQRVIKLLSEFGDKIDEALVHYKPHIVAQYLLELARAFSEFYHASPVLQEADEQTKKARLLLVDCARQVLKNGLSLLGIEAPEEM